MPLRLVELQIRLLFKLLNQHYCLSYIEYLNFALTENQNWSIEHYLQICSLTAIMQNVVKLDTAALQCNRESPTNWSDQAPPIWSARNLIRSLRELNPLVTALELTNNVFLSTFPIRKQPSWPRFRCQQLDRPYNKTMWQTDAESPNSWALMHRQFL